MNKVNNIPSGILVKGIVISSRATARKRKDGTGVFVIAEHEIALQPGMARYEQFLDPDKDPVKLSGLEVKSFPELKAFEEVTLRVDKFKLAGDTLVITRGERIDNNGKETSS